MAKDYNFQACPKCRIGYLRAVGERQGGFSGGKAVLGAVIAGPIGLAFLWLGHPGWALLDYLCVTASWRNDGFGAEMLRMLPQVVTSLQMVPLR